MNRKSSILSLLIAIAISAISCVQYNEINVNLINASSESIELTLKNALIATENFLAEAATSNDTTEKPFIDHFLSISTLLQPVFPQANINWTEVIRMERLREIAENNMRRISESMATVLFNVHFLGESSDSAIQSKMAIVQNIHSGLEQIINVFEQPQSIFRSHPMVAIPSLFALASLVPIYDRIEAIITPALAGTSHISCKLDDILSEYGARVEFYRSEKLRPLVEITKENEAIYLDRFKLLKEARYPEFKPTDEVQVCGFIDGNVTAQSSAHVFYFKDELSSTPGFYGSLMCYSHIVQYYRYRVGVAFDEARNLTQKTCSAEQRSRQTATGDGWLQVVVLAGRAVQRNDKRPCDQTSFIGRLLGRSNPCDPYVKVLANGREIFKTTVKENKSFVQFFEGRISPKIGKANEISIEMWDDNGDNSNDALIYRLNTDVAKLLNDSDEYGYPNFVIVKGFWKDEIIYN